MKLDNLDKKNIYEVPDKYFEELPSRIQKKIESGAGSRLRLAPGWSLLTKLSLPVAAALVLLLVWTNFEKPAKDDKVLSYDKILDQVSSEDMVSYLELQGITSDEILENVNGKQLNESFDNYDDGLIINDDLDDEDIDAILNEYDLGV